MSFNGSQNYKWFIPSNYNGINPPKDKIVPVPFNKTAYKTIYDSAVGSQFNKDLIYINSRSPYAVEYLKTKYGPIGTTLGTSLGTKKD